MTGTKVDFSALASELLSRASSLLYEWLPGGKISGNEFECGDLAGTPGKSLKVNLQTGKWADFAGGQKGGDLISLYAAIKGLSQVDAAKGLGGHYSPPVHIKKSPDSKAKTLIIPPKGTKKPDFVHSKYGPARAVWTYRNPEGEVLYFISRHDTPEGKQFIPWSYTTDSRWVNRAWPEPRLPYGVELLAKHNDRPVLIVEGEKACDAARSIVGDIYTVITWQGGSLAVHKTRFDMLQGQRVLLWPDADEPGIKCMHKLAALLVDLSPEVKVIQPSMEPGENNGWDAADALADGMTWDKFREWAKPRASIYTKPLPPAAPAAPVLPEPSITSGDLPDLNKRGKPLCTIANLKALTDALGIVVRYNVTSKTQEILVPGESFSIDNNAEASIAVLYSWCNRLEMQVGQVMQHITYLADQNPYNPVATWILSKPWDGRSRLEDLFKTVVAKNESGDPTIFKLKRAMIRRWLISAVAGAFSPNGVSAHGVLVFQGEQYLGKTAWFKRLVPKDLGVVAEGMILRPDDKDSVQQAVGFWLVELGELDATFRRSDIAQLKAFLTKDKDILRVAYAKRESQFARRTVFFASVNPAQFLHDNTGNRRFWTVECESINYEHDIDMQQLWAEVHSLYVAGESWFLTKAEMALLNDHNESFLSQDPIEERIGSELAWDSDVSRWDWKTGTQVLLDLGFERPTQADLNKATREICKRNGDQRRRTMNQRLVLVPKKLSKTLQMMPQLSFGQE